MGGTNPVGQNWGTEDGGGGPAGLTPSGIWDHEYLKAGLEGEVTNRVTSVPGTWGNDRTLGKMGPGGDERGIRKGYK